MAYVGRAEEVEPVVYNGEEVRGVKKRVLIGPSKQGAENFIMRLFTLEEGGYTPKHTHPWEHEVFVVEGEVELETEDGVYKLSEHSYAFVKPNEIHQFRNAGSGPASFICVIPVSGGE